ncbi:hypothetical protein NMY22_g6836 [Coprinellus aureogranulatus]|nr:hypothetical protein NMY22_g6836 [Coprinellus aureogranulatus]
MKHNLQQSVSAADIEALVAESPRPDSPTSSDEEMGDNVDWNYAKREAALANNGSVKDARAVPIRAGSCRKGERPHYRAAGLTTVHASDPTESIWKSI